MRDRTRGMTVIKGAEGDALPLEVELGHRATNLAIRLVTGGAILGLIGFALVDDSLFVSIELSSPVGLALIALMAFIAIRLIASTILAFGKSARAKIDSDNVHYSERSVFGNKSWHEPLSSYRGVRWRQEDVISQSGNSSRSRTTTYQLIELAHPKSSRTVPLYRANVSDENARREWERLSRVMSLSAIDSREIDEVVRDTADLDKSIKQLAQEGKLDAAWRDQTPPARLELTYEDAPDGAPTQSMTVALPPRISRTVWRGIQLVVGVFLLIAAFQLHVFGAVVLGASLVGLEFLRRFSERNPRKLTVTRQRISYEDPTQSNAAFAMELSLIEGIDTRRVMIGKTEGSEAFKRAVSKVMSDNVLVLVSDERERQISGLSDPELEWLQQFLRSAVANA